MSTTLTIAEAKKAKYPLSPKKKGRAAKDNVWVQLSDGNSDAYKAQVPKDIAKKKYGWKAKPTKPSKPASDSGGSRLTVGKVAEFIDKSDAERLSDILKGIGFTQRDKIAELIPGIAAKVKQDERDKIDAEIEALKKQKAAIK